MSLFISVINHNHDELIIRLDCLSKLAIAHTVVIHSNTKPTQALFDYCTDNGIHLSFDGVKRGFGANNNFVFNLFTSLYSMCDDDYFLVLNPDVKISKKSTIELLKTVRDEGSDISAINLFKDHAHKVYDNSIRYYPKLLTPLKSLFGIRRTDSYNKNSIDKPIKIQWAAGSFLMFKSTSYRLLNGFDEKYFMYFEDADICTRANRYGLNVRYYPNIKATHLASHKNRELFSVHFIWYIRSSLRYHLAFKYKNVVYFMIQKTNRET